MRVVGLVLVDHRDERAPARAGARQNLARKRRHRLVDFDQIIAENAADPSIAHVEPLSLARRGGRQVVEVDAEHMRRRRRQRRQTFALLLVLPGKPRQKIRANRLRQGLDPTHPPSSAESNADASNHIRIPQGKCFFDGWQELHQ